MAGMKRGAIAIYSQSLKVNSDFSAVKLGCQEEFADVELQGPKWM